MKRTLIASATNLGHALVKVICALLLLIAVKGKAQTTDHAKQDTVKRHREDSAKAVQLELKAWAYADVSTDTSYLLALEGFKYAMRSKQLVTAAYCLTHLGNVYKHRGHLDSAEMVQLKSIELRDIAGSVEDRASGRNTLAWLRIKQDRFVDALRTFDHAISMLPKHRPLPIFSMIKEGKALAYQKLGKNEEAIQSFEAALAANLARGDSLAAAKTLLNIGNFFQEIHRPVVAEKHYERAIMIYSGQQNLYGVAQCQMNLGMNEYQLGRMDAALMRLKGAQRLCENHGFIGLLNDVYNNLALVCNSKGQPAEAARYIRMDYGFCSRNGMRIPTVIAALNLMDIELRQGHFLAVSKLSDSILPLVEEDVQLKIETLDRMSKALAGLQKFELAFRRSRERQNIEDSLKLAADNTQNLADQYIQEKNQRTKAEDEARVLKAEKRARELGIIVLGVLAGMVALLGFVRYRSQQFKIESLTKDAEFAKAAEAERIRLEDISRQLQDAEAGALRLSMETQEQERTRIAKNLHDHLGSKLSIVQMLFQSLGKNIEFKEGKGQDKYLSGIQHLDEACQDVRQLARSMASGDLSHFGLQIALERFCMAAAMAGKVQHTFSPIGTPQNLGAKVETEIYSILRTAIDNILRHADAENFWLTLEYKENTLAISLRDDGKGFEPSSSKEEGMGLKNMRTRTEAMQGTFKLDTKPGSGTTIELSIPIPQSIT